MDVDWLVAYLNEALDLLDTFDNGYRNGFIGEAEAAAIEFDRRLTHLHKVVRKALGHNAPLLLHECSYGGGGNATNRRVIRQAIYALMDGREVLQRLGPPPGPSLLASSLHPTVWDAAKSLWRSEHRRQAVMAAAVAVNAALQQRLGRRDVSDKKIVEQAFTVDPPAEGRPRLRVRPDDGSEVYRSTQLGVMSFGVGCFQALRNPVAHENADVEPDEQTALEELAAFSRLMRWIDAAALCEFEPAAAGESAA